MTGRAALLAALAASIVAALPADGREGSRPPVRDCAARAEGPSPPSDRPRRGDLAVGPVIFIGGRAHARSPRSDFAPVRPGRYQPVKLPVTVRAGRRVTIGIARRQRRAVALVFSPQALRRPTPNRISDGDPRVTFAPCPPGTPAFSHPGTVGPRTAFPGGFVVAGARCARLLVRVEGRRRALRATISFGAGRCRR